MAESDRYTYVLTGQQCKDIYRTGLDNFPVPRACPGALNVLLSGGIYETVLFLSVSIDGLISDKDDIPLFPEGAWEDWCSLVNEADNVIAGRSSFQQLNNDEMASVLNPKHNIVLSSGDINLGDSGWQHARFRAEALEILKDAGVDKAIVGGGRAVAYSFMREQLIDNIDLQPVAFGVGTPVFGDELSLTRLQLLDSRL